MTSCAARRSRPPEGLRTPRRFGVGFVLLLAAIAAGGCGAAGRREPAKATRGEAAPRPPRFVDDDYARARDDARASKKLLFVDAWAPWCHSCLSLRSFVLQDPRLGSLDDRYAWLAIDTELPKNDAFVRKFPNRAWPTLYVIDPERESVLLSWPGTMTAPELESRLVELASERHAVDAPEAAVYRLASSKAHAACADLALRTFSNLRGTSRAAVVATGIDCAGEVKGSEGPALVDEGKRLLSDAALLADDRSSLYEALVGYLDRANEKDSAKTLATAWASFLEGEAAGAKTPEARAVFDAHRVLAYLRIGEPDRALPMLEQSAKDFPKDYNPHARLAKVLLEKRELARAEREAKLAAELVYGPRTLRVFALLADVLEARGQRNEAAAALQRALERTEGLALGPGAQDQRTAIVARRAALTGGR